MFRRRKNRSLLVKLRESVWPTIGWRRAGTYLAHRIRRMPGTPESIAAGMACGVAVSFTPFIGFHFVIAAMISWVLGGNLLASAIGTAAGNPWTFPFIWAWIYTLGHWVLGTAPNVDGPNNLTLQYISSHVWDIFLPMMTGGVPTALVVWFAVYYPLRRAIQVYQERRRQRRMEGKRRRVAAAALAALRRKSDSAAPHGSDGSAQAKD